MARPFHLEVRALWVPRIIFRICRFEPWKHAPLTSVCDLDRLRNQ